MLGSGHFSYVGSYQAVPAGADGSVMLTVNGSISLAGNPKGPWTGVHSILENGKPDFYAWDIRQGEGSQVPFSARYKLVATLSGQTTVTKVLHSSKFFDGSRFNSSLFLGAEANGTAQKGSPSCGSLTVRRDATIGGLMEVVADEGGDFGFYQVKLKPGVVLTVEYSYSGAVDSYTGVYFGANAWQQLNNSCA